MSPRSECSFTYSVAQAIQREDEDKITDLRDAAKTTVTHNHDPERFTCKLSKYSQKQPAQKRLYL